MPSKKIWITLIICLGILISVSIFQWGTNTKIINPASQNLAVVGNDTKSDPNANLKSWQETLSVITGTTTDLTGSGNASTEDNNLTSQMAKNYFGQFLTLSAGGQTSLTDADANQIAQNAINTTDTTIQAKIYTEKDLKTEPTNTANVNTYFEAMNTTFSKNDIILKENELDILNQAVVSGKQSDLDKINPMISGYNQILSDLIKMPVPSEAVNLHLELTNVVSEIISDVDSMKNTLIDPVKGLTAIKLYQSDYSNFILSIQKFGAYFKIKKIIK